MSAQQRIRVIAGPWPERIGCEGHIADDPGDGVYPFNKRGSGEAIIKLDDDPLIDLDREREFPRNWTCVMDAADVELILEYGRPE